MQSLPLVLGSLDIRDLEGRQHGPAAGGKGKFLEEKLGSLPEIHTCPFKVWMFLAASLLAAV